MAKYKVLTIMTVLQLLGRTTNVYGQNKRSESVYDKIKSDSNFDADFSQTGKYFGKYQIGESSKGDQCFYYRFEQTSQCMADDYKGVVHEDKGELPAALENRIDTMHKGHPLSYLRRWAMDDNTKDNIALVYQKDDDEETMTYQKLYHRVCALADYLRDKEKLLPQSLVGVHLANSTGADYVIAMYAIWKVRGIYQPFNTEEATENVLGNITNTLQYLKTMYLEELKKVLENFDKETDSDPIKALVTKLLESNDASIKFNAQELEIMQELNELIPREKRPIDLFEQSEKLLNKRSFLINNSELPGLTYSSDDEWLSIEPPTKDPSLKEGDAAYIFMSSGTSNPNKRKTIVSWFLGLTERMISYGVRLGLADPDDVSYNLNRDDRDCFAGIAKHNFDASTLEKILPIYFGIKSYCFPSDKYDDVPNTLVKMAKRGHRPTYMEFSPDVLASLDVNNFLGVKAVCVFGTLPNINDLASWVESKIKIFNGHGLTETLIANIVTEITLDIWGKRGDSKFLPLDNPLKGTELFFVENTEKTDEINDTNIVDKDSLIKQKDLKNGTEYLLVIGPAPGTEKGGMGYILNPPEKQEQTFRKDRDGRVYCFTNDRFSLERVGLVCKGREGMIKVAGIQIMTEELEADLEFQGNNTDSAHIEWVACTVTPKGSLVLFVKPNQTVERQLLLNHINSVVSPIIKQYLPLEVSEKIISERRKKVHEFPRLIKAATSIIQPEGPNITKNTSNTSFHEIIESIESIWRETIGNDVLKDFRIGSETSFSHLGGTSLLFAKMRDALLNALFDSPKDDKELKQLFLPDQTISDIAALVKKYNEAKPKVEILSEGSGVKYYYVHEEQEVSKEVRMLRVLQHPEKPRIIDLSFSTNQVRQLCHKDESIANCTRVMLRAQLAHHVVNDSMTAFVILTPQNSSLLEVIRPLEVAENFVWYDLEKNKDGHLCASEHPKSPGSLAKPIISFGEMINKTTAECFHRTIIMKIMNLLPVVHYKKSDFAMEIKNCFEGLLSTDENPESSKVSRVIMAPPGAGLSDAVRYQLEELNREPRETSMLKEKFIIYWDLLGKRSIDLEDYLREELRLTDPELGYLRNKHIIIVCDHIDRMTRVDYPIVSVPRKNAEFSPSMSWVMLQHTNSWQPANGKYITIGDETKKHKILDLPETPGMQRLLRGISHIENESSADKFIAEYLRRWYLEQKKDSSIIRLKEFMQYLKRIANLTHAKLSELNHSRVDSPWTNGIPQKEELLTWSPNFRLVCQLLNKGWDKPYWLNIKSFALSEFCSQDQLKALKEELRDFDKETASDPIKALVTKLLESNDVSTNFNAQELETMQELKELIPREKRPVNLFEQMAKLLNKTTMEKIVNYTNGLTKGVSENISYDLLNEDDHKLIGENNLAGRWLVHGKVIFAWLPITGSSIPDYDKLVSSARGGARKILMFSLNKQMVRRLI